MNDIELQEAQNAGDLWERVERLRKLAEHVPDIHTARRMWEYYKTVEKQARELERKREI